MRKKRKKRKKWAGECKRAHGNGVARTMVPQKAQEAQKFEKGCRSPQERKSRAGVVRKNAQ